MVHGLIRSPSSYFDITPTGRLNNNFSNDLGIMDNTLSFVLADCIEDPIRCIVMIINVFTINLYFLIPGIINVVFIVGFFLYCKEVIIAVKQLDLTLKTPIFHMVGETISGLIQLKIFNQRFHFLSQFSKKLNESFKANIAFWNISRAFGANISYFSTLVMIIGWIIGIAVVTPESVGLYAVSVLFLL